VYLKLIIDKAENVTIGDICKVVSAIKKEGYKVEALPTEIKPIVIVVRKEG